MVSYNFPGTIHADGFLRELPLIVNTIPASYISRQRWFGSKASTIAGVELFDATMLRNKLPFYIMSLIEVRFEHGFSELYYIPFVLRRPVGMAGTDTESGSTIVTVTTLEGHYELADALSGDLYLKSLFQHLVVSAEIKSIKGQFIFRYTQVLPDAVGDLTRYSIDTLRRLKGEQSNTSVIYNESWIMKNFRKITSGANPDLEVPLFLTTRTHYRNIPPVAGYIEHVTENGTRSAIASLQLFIPNEGDGWRYTLDHLEQLYRFAIGRLLHEKTQVTVPESTQTIKQFSDSYLHNINTLGRITGELHNALASDFSSPDFAPEPISGEDVSSWIAHSQSYCSQILHNLSKQGRAFSPCISEKIDRVLSHRSFYMNKIEGLAILAEEAIYKTRYHNDYHLGQVLKTVSDFIIIDFEGEPARPLEERRAKHSPLKDVAGMMRSFNYALYAALFTIVENYGGQRELMENAGKIWEALTRETYLGGYLDAALKQDGAAVFLPHSRDAIFDVLSVFELDKAVYELNYEINNRPSWVVIPLEYLVSLI
jgi:maltose alpha-D-glucosyltransferase/alpha-amylase